jgi:hypothetical protein
LIDIILAVETLNPIANMGAANARNDMAASLSKPG